MNKLLIIAALLLAQNANAEHGGSEHKTETHAEKPAKKLTLQEQIAADAQRDPYAEAPESTIRYQIKETTVVEGYEPPVAAEQMQPAKFTKMKNGNTVIKRW